MAGEEKTEKATPKKRKDTRKKGEVLQSKEVAVAVFVVGIFAFLAIFGNYMFQMLLNFMEQSMSSIDKTGNTVEFAMSVFWKVAIICVCTVGPILAVGVVLSVKSNMVYTLCKHMVYMLSITNEHKNELEMRAKPEWKVHFLCFASAKRGSFSIR